MAAVALAAAVTHITPGPGGHLTAMRPKVTPRVLSVTLLSADQDFLTDYRLIRTAMPGEERPVGLPSAFIPLDGVGALLRKRSIVLHPTPYRGGSGGLPHVTPSSSPSSSSKWLRGRGSKKGSVSSGSAIAVPDSQCDLNPLGAGRSFVVSVFCKATSTTHTAKRTSALSGTGLDNDENDVISNAAKGLVIRLQDETPHVLVLHVAASELQRVCALEEPSLLTDMNSLKECSLNKPRLDSLSKGLRSIFDGDDMQVIFLYST